MHKGISLKVVWYGLIVLVALAPVAILLPWLVAKAHTLLLESALSREVQFNEAIKTHVDLEVSRIITLLQNKSDPMAYTLAGTIDKDLLNGLLDAVISREDAIHVLTLVDRQGLLVVGKDRHGDPLRGTTGSSATGSQKEGQAGHEPLFDPQGPEVVIPLHGRIYTGQPFFQEGELNFHLAVPVGPPIHPSLAVLVATIDAGKLWQGIQTRLSRPGVSTYLVDSRGSLLAPPVGSEQPAGALLSHMDIVRSLIARKDWVKTDTYIGLNGLSGFGAATLIDSLNWGVISEIPASTITGPIVTTLVTVAVIAAVLVVVFGALGLGLVNRMLRPMSELSGAFDRVAQGDYSKDIPSSPVKEFNSLVAGFNHMIFERKRAEERETSLGRILDGSLNEIYIFDIDTLRFIQVNRGAMKNLGYSIEELRRLTPLDLKPEFTPASLARLVAPLRNGEKEKIQFNTVHRRKDGSLYPVEIHLQLSTFESAPVFVAIILDITERKRTEETVRNIAAGVSAQTGEAFFQSLVLHLAKIFDAKYTFIGLLDEQRPNRVDTVAFCIHGKIVDNQGYDLAHTPCERVVGGNCDELQAYPRDIQRLFPNDPMLEEMGAHSYVGAPLADTTGKPIGLIVVMDNKPMDNTEQVETILKIFAVRAGGEMERLKAEEKLAHSKAEFEAMFNSIPDAVMFADTERRIVMNNPAVHEMFGYSDQELIGRTTEMLYADRNDFLAQGRRRYRVGSDTEQGPYEVRYKRKDGTVFWTETLGTQVKDANGNAIGFIALFRDITERVKIEKELEQYRDHLEELVEERTAELHTAQDELLRKERLATLGQLTATVSHELRNPLGTLRNSLFNIGAKVKDKKLGMDKVLTRMERSISRCDNIIEEMLDYTRVRELELKTTAIDDWLAEVLREQTRPKNISLEQDLVAGVSLEIDIEYLRRAIINIFDNACQALSELPETAKRVREISVRTAVEDTRLLITIADNGPGIAGDVLTHIFEPLYSTKGFGVGLGLPIVKQILEQHGGGVDISSADGQGTQVILWFPLVGKE